MNSADEADASARHEPRRYVTAEVPGVGGVLRERPEDFLVEEIPAYEPSGEGEHLYMLVQKRELSTMELVSILASHFRVERHAIGYAGLKDKHAITRQVVSVHVPGRREEEFPELRHERVGVLWVDRHANKLRPGHLKGNRFSIRIRGVKFQDVRHAKRTLEILERVGVPNRVGEQRFGMLRNNHLVGRALIAREFQRAADELLGPSVTRPDLNPEARRLYAEGKFAEARESLPRSAATEREVLRLLARGRDVRSAVCAIDQAVLRYYVSAFQSAIFNRVLDERLSAGTLDRLVAGDLAFKHENGAVFAVDEGVLSDADTAGRALRLEISPTGPMWSGAMMRAGGDVDAMELSAFASTGVTLEQLGAFTERAGQLIEGKRRALRVPLTVPMVEGGVDEHGAFIRVAFDLPRGSFATAVLPEIMKNPAAEVDEGEVAEKH